MYVVWKNPDSEANVVYDGVEALMKVKVTNAADWTSVDDAGSLTAPPTIQMVFEDTAVSGTYFDMSPGSTYAAGAEN